MVRVSHVRPTQKFEVELRFTDGSVKTVDLDHLMRGAIFDAIRRDRALFERVTVDPQLGTLVWPNGADMCPDVLYHGRPPAV